jgi:oligoendopeptidase F
VVEYREYLKHKPLLARHTLTELEEKIISTLEVTGTNALIKISDRMTSGFDCVMTIKKGKKIVKKKFSNKEKMLSLIRGANREERKAAYKSLLQVYKKNSGVLGEIYLNRVIQWRDEGVKL